MDRRRNRAVARRCSGVDGPDEALEYYYVAGRDGRKQKIILKFEILRSAQQLTA